MSRLVVMMPNTLSRAFESIDTLADEGSVRPDDCAVLKGLYASGWQDGFVAAPLDTLARGLGLTQTRLLASLKELERVLAVHVRMTVADDVVVEILSLSRPWVTGDVGLGWWQYYLVEEEADGSADGDAA